MKQVVRPDADSLATTPDELTQAKADSDSVEIRSHHLINDHNFEDTDIKLMTW